MLCHNIAADIGDSDSCDNTQLKQLTQMMSRHLNLLTVVNRFLRKQDNSDSIATLATLEAGTPWANKAGLHIKIVKDSCEK